MNEEEQAALAHLNEQAKAVWLVRSGGDPYGRPIDVLMSDCSVLAEHVAKQDVRIGKLLARLEKLELNHG